MNYKLNSYTSNESSKKIRRRQFLSEYNGFLAAFVQDRYQREASISLDVDRIPSNLVALDVDITKEINAIHNDIQNGKDKHGEIDINAGIHPGPMIIEPNNNGNHHVTKDLDSLDIFPMKYAQNEIKNKENKTNPDLCGPTHGKSAENYIVIYIKI